MNVEDKDKGKDADNETKILTKLNGHENIVKYFDHFLIQTEIHLNQNQTLLCIVMEYCEVIVYLFFKLKF